MVSSLVSTFGHPTEKTGYWGAGNISRRLFFSVMSRDAPDKGILVESSPVLWMVMRTHIVDEFHEGEDLRRMD
ncbi:hypothetical protein TNCV_3977571 [Trichonephila clavipes]|nr:hypothetical protein TNCV_3977571 [Trichonephila clavipes]